MTKKKDPKDLKKRGPKEIAHTIDLEQLEKLCMLGATNKEIADFYGISIETLDTYKNKYPGILEAIKRGKEIADMTVSESLYKRATGYKHEDTHVFLYRGQPVTVKVMKHYPPDATSMIFWLKNRRPEQWREKIQVDNNHSGKIDVIDYTKVSTEALQELLNAAKKEEKK